MPQVHAVHDDASGELCRAEAQAYRGSCVCLCLCVDD